MLFIKKKILFFLSFSIASPIINFLVSIKKPRFFIRGVIKHYFIKKLKVDTKEALLETKDYETILSFFTRKLKKEARKIDQSSQSIVSPSDGNIGSFGKINKNKLFQAKGKIYYLEDLLSQDTATNYYDGFYMTTYLAPSDYHRVHHPLQASITKTTFYPGKLLPVNEFSIHHFENVYTQNKRVVIHYKKKKKPCCFSTRRSFECGKYHTLL